ncbi:MAG: RNA polymerase sigma factor [Planctomycetota bacterium]|jgi:RNA polymerase sigma-70 factor (ECF subfamily)
MPTIPAASSDDVVALRDAIYAYVLTIVRDPTEAQDLTQDTMLRAHRGLASLKNPARSKAWLYRIATNVCYDRLRQRATRQPPTSLDAGGRDEESAVVPEDDAPRLDKVMEQEEMSACVQRYLERIPDSYRAVLFLHDVQGLKNREIAAMLGISLATAKIRLHRAREKLRVALDEACRFSTDERGVQVCEPKPPPPEAEP